MTPPEAAAAAAAAPHQPAALNRQTLIRLGASMLLIAFSLRTPVTSLGPVLREAIHSTGLTIAEASLLTTLPSLCFGVFAPIAPSLARRMGLERALFAMIVLLAAGTALRVFANAGALFAGSILAYAGIAVVNVLLPGLVKRDFPRRTALITGLYTMAFCGGAAGAAALTVPLETALGGSWSAALAIWAAPAAIAAAIWAAQMPAAANGMRPPRYHVRGLWTDALAWQVTLFMGLQSALAYIVFGWLAQILRDRGLDAATAGFVLSVSVLAQAASSAFAPALATRGPTQSWWNVGALALTAVALLALLWAPLGTVWVWAVVLGVSQGAQIAIALTMIVLRAPDAHVASHLSSMAQTVGYILASAGPLLAGLLHGWTGGWGAVGLFCTGIAVVAALAGYGAGRDRHVGAVSVPAGSG